MEASNTQASPEPYKTKPLARAVAIACLIGAAGAAHAGGTISLGDDKSISIGLGLRTSYSSFENAASNGSSRSSDFNVDNARLLIGASLSKEIKLNFNTEKDANDNVKILDAYGEFQYSPEFNIAMGRTIIPSDRANLSGTFFMPSYQFAGTASQFYSKFASRDDGAVVWGKLMDKALVYSVGIFQGRGRDAGMSNTSDSMLYAGRLAVNFWDAEPAPSYFTGSTYYGTADIFTIGLVAQSQKNGVGTAAIRDDYTAYGIDLLLEKKLSAGVFTLEGAFSKYDFSTAAGTADGAATPGDAGLVGLAYLFPQQVGWGKLQPYYRYQKFSSDMGSASDIKQHDLGLNYVINADNTKLSATYTTKKIGDGEDIDGFILGLQLMF